MRIVESREELAKFLNWFVAQNRILAGYNSARFDVPLIRGILRGIDPYAPAQAIIKDDKLPPALANIPELPCDHIDISARLRRGGSFPSLKVVAARLGRPTLRELPYPPHAILTDQQWQEVKRYNVVDLQHTRALLERVAPELAALAALSQEQGQDLRSVSSPQVVEKIFLAAYFAKHGRDPVRDEWPEVRYRPVPGVQRPRTWDAADWFDKLANEPMPMRGSRDTRRFEVPTAKFIIGQLRVSVGAGGLHSVDFPGVYYGTRKRSLLSVDVQSFYPSLIASKGIAPAGYGDTGRATYQALLARRLAVKQASKVATDPVERERLTAQADGLKLVLNSFFGKTGDPHASLYDPAAFLSVTLSGQLMLIDLIERLTDAGVKVISANTDGLFLSADRQERSWRDILATWQTDTGMSLEVESLRRLAILASNEYATRDRRDKVKRRGGLLKGSFSWQHSPNMLVVNDAVAQALLFDVPPERTIFECRDTARLCAITTKGHAATLVLAEGDKETELPRVTRWYRAKDGFRRIERRFPDGRKITVPGAQSVAILQDLPEHGLPDDLDWNWYLREARRVIQRVPGYRHRSKQRLLNHGPALEVVGSGLLPVPKHGKAQPAGSDAHHPTLLWSWPDYPTLGCYTGPAVATLVLDVDDPVKFRGFVERGNSPLFGDRWNTLDGSLVSFHGDATPEGVRTGRQRGKLIFRLTGDANHPLGRIKARWKKRHGIEVFYGNGLPSILGHYDSNGDRYRLDGTLGNLPDWLVLALLPKQRRSIKATAAMSPESRQAALEGLPAILAELAPELGQPSVGWRRKDVAYGREIWVGRCPFEHDSGRSETGDLDAGYHDDGPYVRCLHGSCARVQEINHLLKVRHQQEHPAAQDDPGTDARPADAPPAIPATATSGHKKCEPRESQGQILLKLAAPAVLWHTPEPRGYASLPLNGRSEHHEVRSTGVRRWLTRAYYLVCGKPPSAEAMQGAIGVLEAQAVYDGPEMSVYVRCAERDGTLYLDLCEADWRVVAIDADGWRVVADAPVRFRRPAGLLALPEPRRGGSLLMKPRPLAV
jgi:hypothetical protein